MLDLLIDRKRSIITQCSSLLMTLQAYYPAITVSVLFQVNEQFAINLVAEEPPVVVKGTHTWCDGGTYG